MGTALISMFATVLLGGALAFLLAVRLVGAERTGGWAGRVVRGVARDPLARGALGFVRRHRRGVTIAGIAVGVVLLPFLFAATVLVLALLVAARVLVYVIENGALDSQTQSEERVVGWHDANDDMRSTEEEAEMHGGAYPIRRSW